jgi:hypothetical protein
VLFPIAVVSTGAPTKETALVQIPAFAIPVTADPTAVTNCCAPICRAVAAMERALTERNVYVFVVLPEKYAILLSAWATAQGMVTVPARTSVNVTMVGLGPTAVALRANSSNSAQVSHRLICVCIPCVRAK